MAIFIYLVIYLFVYFFILDFIVKKGGCFFYLHTYLSLFKKIGKPNAISRGVKIIERGSV